MDPNLHHNGEMCPACECRRESRNPMDETPVPCNNCGGSGRVTRGETTVIRDCVTWAKKHYWPERERRWAEQNGAI